MTTHWNSFIKTYFSWLVQISLRWIYSCKLRVLRKWLMDKVCHSKMMCACLYTGERVDTEILRGSLSSCVEMPMQFVHGEVTVRELLLLFSHTNLAKPFPLQAFCPTSSLLSVTLKDRTQTQWLHWICFLFPEEMKLSRVKWIYLQF